MTKIAVLTVATDQQRVAAFKELFGYADANLFPDCQVEFFVLSDDPTVQGMLALRQRQHKHQARFAKLEAALARAARAVNPLYTQAAELNPQAAGDAQTAANPAANTKAKSKSTRELFFASFLALQNQTFATRYQLAIPTLAKVAVHQEQFTDLGKAKAGTTQKVATNAAGLEQVSPQAPLNLGELVFGEGVEETGEIHAQNQKQNQQNLDQDLAQAINLKSLRLTNALTAAQALPQNLNNSKSAGASANPSTEGVYEGLTFLGTQLDQAALFTFSQLDRVEQLVKLGVDIQRLSNLAKPLEVAPTSLDLSALGMNLPLLQQADAQALAALAGRLKVANALCALKASESEFKNAAKAAKQAKPDKQAQPQKQAQPEGLSPQAPAAQTSATAAQALPFTLPDPLKNLKSGQWKIFYSTLEHLKNQDRQAILLKLQERLEGNTSAAETTQAVLNQADSQEAVNQVVNQENLQADLQRLCLVHTLNSLYFDQLSPQLAQECLDSVIGVNFDRWIIPVISQEQAQASQAQELERKLHLNALLQQQLVRNTKVLEPKFTEQKLDPASDADKAADAALEATKLVKHEFDLALLAQDADFVTQLRQLVHKHADFADEIELDLEPTEILRSLIAYQKTTPDSPWFDSVGDSAELLGAELTAPSAQAETYLDIPKQRPAHFVSVSGDCDYLPDLVSMLRATKSLVAGFDLVFYWDPRVLVKNRTELERFYDGQFANKPLYLFTQDTVANALNEQDTLKPSQAQAYADTLENEFNALLEAYYDAPAPTHAVANAIDPEALAQLTTAPTNKNLLQQVSDLKESFMPELGRAVLRVNPPLDMLKDQAIVDYGFMPWQRVTGALPNELPTNLRRIDDLIFGASASEFYAILDYVGFEVGVNLMRRVVPNLSHNLQALELLKELCANKCLNGEHDLGTLLAQNLSQNLSEKLSQNLSEKPTQASASTATPDANLLSELQPDSASQAQPASQNQLDASTSASLTHPLTATKRTHTKAELKDATDLASYLAQAFAPEYATAGGLSQWQEWLAHMASYFPDLSTAQADTQARVDFLAKNQDVNYYQGDEFQVMPTSDSTDLYKQLIADYQTYGKAVSGLPKYPYKLPLKLHFNSLVYNWCQLSNIIKTPPLGGSLLQFVDSIRQQAAQLEHLTFTLMNLGGDELKKLVYNMRKVDYYNHELTNQGPKYNHLTDKQAKLRREKSLAIIAYCDKIKQELVELAGYFDSFIRKVATTRQIRLQGDGLLAAQNYNLVSQYVNARPLYCMIALQGQNQVEFARGVKLEQEIDYFYLLSGIHPVARELRKATLMQPEELQAYIKGEVDKIEFNSACGHEFAVWSNEVPEF